MFSTNETYEEIATEDLKYLLLPFFLAQLTLKICNVDRKEIVGVAEVYFK
jgi:immunoglobulin-binding protein 1